MSLPLDYNASYDTEFGAVHGEPDIVLRPGHGLAPAGTAIGVINNQF